MTSGDNINNIKSMYTRESRYIEGLTKIRSILSSIEDKPIAFVLPSIHGLISYIGDLLDE